METQLRLYIGNLPVDATESMICEELFSSALDICSIKLVKDSRSGQSKGFGFLTIDTATAAQSIINRLNGTLYRSRKLLIMYAKESNSVSPHADARKAVPVTDGSKMSRRKAAKHNFKRRNDDDFRGPWR